MISYMMSCREQDCVVVLGPYPNNPNPVESFNIKTDFDLTGDGLVWYAHPQLFFKRLQLYIVPNRCQEAQRFTQRGFPGLFQHV